MRRNAKAEARKARNLRVSEFKEEQLRREYAVELDLDRPFHEGVVDYGYSKLKVIVDEEDKHLLEQPWNFTPDRGMYRHEGRGKDTKRFTLMREVARALLGEQCRSFNGDPLDYRRCNVLKRPQPWGPGTVSLRIKRQQAQAQIMARLHADHQMQDPDSAASHVWNATARKLVDISLPEYVAMTKRIIGSPEGYAMVLQIFNAASRPKTVPVKAKAAPPEDYEKNCRGYAALDFEGTEGPCGGDIGSVKDKAGYVMTNETLQFWVDHGGEAPHTWITQYMRKLLDRVRA